MKKIIRESKMNKTCKDNLNQDLKEDENLVLQERKSKKMVKPMYKGEGRPASPLESEKRKAMIEKIEKAKQLLLDNIATDGEDLRNVANCSSPKPVTAQCERKRITLTQCNDNNLEHFRGGQSNRTSTARQSIENENQLPYLQDQYLSNPIHSQPS